MKAVYKWGRRATVAVGLLLMATTVWSEHSGYHKVVDGMSVYFTIIPAEMVRGHSREHPESEMHGGVPAGESHIMVALFDDKTGERIMRTEITARVSGGHAENIEKRLDPMVIGGSLTFGNYFSLGGSGPYQVELRIDAPGQNKPISVRFEWARS